MILPNSLELSSRTRCAAAAVTLLAFLAGTPAEPTVPAPPAAPPSNPTWIPKAPVPPAAAPAGRASLHGRVVAAGRPVRGAHVVLLGCGAQLELRSEAGSFLFVGLAPGADCRLRVTDPATGRVREELVETGMSVVVDLR